MLQEGVGSTVTKSSIPGSIGELSDSMGLPSSPAASAGKGALSRSFRTVLQKKMGWTLDLKKMSECDLCLSLGVGIDNHHYKGCYTNPAGCKGLDSLW